MYHLKSHDATGEYKTRIRRSVTPQPRMQGTEMYIEYFTAVQ